MIHPAFSFWIVPVLLSLPEGPAAPPDSAGGQAPASAIGVRVEFPEKKIAPEDRNPDAERKAILGATAVLKTERPIRYRSVVLPPGTYPITVAADEERGKNLFFVIGPRAEGAGGSGGGTPAPEASKPEDKKSEKDGGKAGGAVQPGGKGGDAIKGGGNGNGDGNGNGKGDGPRARGRKTVSGQIRALFHLAPCKAPAEGVQFSIGSSARANRFVLTVRAGSTEGKANLRLES